MECHVPIWLYYVLWAFAGLIVILYAIVWILTAWFKELFLDDIEEEESQL